LFSQAVHKAGSERHLSQVSIWATFTPLLKNLPYASPMLCAERLGKVTVAGKHLRQLA
jgi:hypothetical protein